MRITLSVAVLSLALAGPAVAADPVEGVRQTRPADGGYFGHIRIAPCAAQLCGKRIRAHDERGRPVESDPVGKWKRVP